METKEVWKDIKEFDGYQVSNLGRVKTKNRTNKSGYKLQENILLTRSTNQKYCSVSFRIDGKLITRQVGKLVASAFLKQDKNKKYVIHKDGDNFNNNLDNLYWGTYYDTGRKQNPIYAVKNGKTQLFRGVNDCAKKLGLIPSSISYCLKKPGVYTHRGYTFKRVEEK